MPEASEDLPGIPEPLRPLDPERVAQIADLIIPGPVGPGRSIRDRTAWRDLAKMATFSGLPSEAAALLSEPLLPLTEDIYFDHVRTGGQEVYNHYNRTTRGRFTKLVLAECVEDEGRFLPAIHESIQAVCAEPTWVHAFHDRQLDNWHGRKVEIDLSSSTMAYRLAVADHFLGDRLDVDVRETVHSEIHCRVGSPFAAMLEGQLLTINQDEPFTWLELNHNWNAVCLANVVGTVLLISGSREQRASCVAAAERYIRNFLSGFGVDGSCLEGMNYWNFGFSHFLLLGEAIWQATGGVIDLFADDRVAQIARFGARMEIVPGVYPAFADCQADVLPLPDVMRYISQRFGLGLAMWETADPQASALPFVANFAFPNSSIRTKTAGNGDAELARRSWFEQAQVFVGRPEPSNPGGLGVAFKGGCNAEHHNHNDLGSFVVAAHGKALLSDPGSELYTARTFSPKRYESSLLNSYGHPVPLVAGTMQHAGTEARATVIKRIFKEEKDRVVLDLRHGYAVPDLKKLNRTFVFSRRARGELVVTDEVAFSNPCKFEVALVTFEPWRHEGEGVMVIGQGATALRMDLRVVGASFRIRAKQIEEDITVKTRPTRIAIVLEDPVLEALVEVLIRPADG